MKNKRFNNVEMLKRNIERIFTAPYYKGLADKMIAEHNANQISRPGEIMWVGDEYRDPKYDS